MAVTAGQTLRVTIEKPAAGGRMIARYEGQVLLVAGAIPAELVTAQVSRIGKGVAYADTLQVHDPSPDRRDPFTDPFCGGCFYAHVAYPRQLELKSRIIADAFGRIGRLPLHAPVRVAASGEEGYRMRARLHVRGGRAGFFREGSHDLCDARATRQLLAEACDAVDRVADALRVAGLGAVREIDLSENTDASQRVVHLEAAEPVPEMPERIIDAAAGLQGLSIDAAGSPRILSGSLHVTDVVAIDGHALVLRRHALAFFQGNRYLLQPLVAHVAERVPRGASVVDLYAGGGLFSLAAAVARGARVSAVEGDRISAADLRENAKAAAGSVEAAFEPVESFTARTKLRPDVVIVDPPRTGMSREALAGAIGLRAAIVVYVSCDIATLARDARRLVDAGYAVDRVDAFDLFPNTPHVETVAVLRKTG